MTRTKTVLGILAALPLLAATAMQACAEDVIKLAIGARGNWETAAAELGQNAGIFKKRGVVLEIFYTQGSGETQQVVIGGSANVGIGLGTTSVMNAFAKGAPVRAVGNASTGSSEYWYVPAASPIQSMKDAAGKTIAYSTAGASSHMEVLAFLKHYGIDARPTATGGTASTFTQVMSGQIDIGWASPPFGLDALQQGKIRIVGRGSDLPYFRDQTIRLIVANDSYLANNKDAVARFIQGYRDTLEWMYSTPEGLKAYAAFAKVPEEMVVQVRDTFYPKHNMLVDRVSGLDTVMADGVAFKFLAAPLSNEQIAQLFQIPPAIK
jgi:NitT/TauT family transport system substrate-binding protein